MEDEDTTAPGRPGRPMCYCGERPAAFAIDRGRLPVCMPCYESYMRASDIQRRQHERILNNLVGQMEAISGVSVGWPRFPDDPPAISYTNAPVSHNVSIQNSTVGAVVTGHVERLNAFANVVNSSNPELATALKEFTEAAAQEGQLSDEYREEVLTLLEQIAAMAMSNPPTAANQPAATRARTIARPWLSRIGELAQGSAALLEIWDRLRLLLPF